MSVLIVLALALHKDKLKVLDIDLDVEVKRLCPGASCGHCFILTQVASFSVLQTYLS